MKNQEIFYKYLIEIFKNHKIIKIFQKENFEKKELKNLLMILKKKQSKN